MDIKSVLIEYEDTSSNEIYTGSGCAFSNQYAITTANIFEPYFNKNTGIDDFVRKHPLGSLNFGTIPKQQSKVKIISKSKSDELLFKKGLVIATFTSSIVLRNSQKYLKTWSVDTENDSSQNTHTLSLFLVIEIGNSSSSRFLNDLDDLEKELIRFFDFVESSKLRAAQDIFIDSVPFGSRHFLNSYSQGIVSNVFGEDGVFFLSDCPTVPGSEGATIFLKNRGTPIGIVLSSLNWCKGEWLGLTLGINLKILLAEMLGTKTISRIPEEINHEQYFESVISNSLALIISGMQWGTGILINKEKGMFITNSHVVENETSPVLYYKNRKIQANTIYQTPNSEVFDLAILNCDPKCVEDMKEMQLSDSTVLAGEDVYASGFSVFPKEANPKPFFSKGHVAHADEAIFKTTCCINPGSSGGAIVRPNGQLVGVIVGNTTVEDTGASYPRINMAIPIHAVKPIIWDYFQKEDTAILNYLHVKDVDVRNRWNFVNSKL